jgi:hypothetical protein
MTKTPTQTGLLRPARPEDGVEASKLMRGLGLTMPETPAKIAVHWQRLWVDNPAIKADGEKSSLGWVLEKDGKMVGFFCNVPLLYYFGKRRVRVSVASQWGLDKSHRRKIHQLAGAYFDQEEADLLMATTANKSAGRIFEHYGARPIPQADYDRALYWIIDGGGFMNSALKRKNVPTLLASVFSALAGPFLSMALSLTGRKPSGHKADVDLMAVDDIDDRFDDLWQRKRDEAPRLLACRTAHSLRWHFADTAVDKNTRVLVHGKEKLRGYCIILREDRDQIGLRRLRIADLFVEHNDPGVVNDLLGAAFDHGRAHGCQVLEWVGMPADLRRTALHHKPLVRTLPTWPLFYKVTDDDLGTALLEPDAWYITLYDGDTILA